MTQKLNGWICDICGKFIPFSQKDKLYTAQGKKRELHFCSLQHKVKYLKMKNGYSSSKK